MLGASNIRQHRSGCGTCSASRHDQEYERRAATPTRARDRVLEEIMLDPHGG